MEAEHEAWLGEVDGLRVSLAGANGKLAQMDAAQLRRSGAVHLSLTALTAPAEPGTDAGSAKETA